MFLSLDEKAIHWFSKEFEINAPFSIRLFPQYAGFGQKHKGYSLAFSAETPVNASFTQEMNGLIFFIEENDRWFFEDTKTYLFFDEVLKELAVRYEEETFLLN
ncbi:hypothetical protein D1B31_19895 [Neobacillus notoginsengisoli]|uniref:HesB/YadR/YfhF family protein n=2 Tax=Neobacillus notoginsengisoli TaxID=1578198 RepID=A0A417YLE2_9BACI|nr:hypothetical protein D1B31_19895 [Neobacillus notoginsengisoli]